MASPQQYDISQTIIPFLDPFLIEPILQFLKSKNFYEAAQIDAFSKAINDKIFNLNPDKVVSAILDQDWKKASEELMHHREALETRLQKVPLFSHESINDRSKMLHIVLYVYLKSQQPTQPQKVEMPVAPAATAVAPTSTAEDEVPLEAEEPQEDDDQEKRESEEKESKLQLINAASFLVDMLLNDKNLNLIKTKCPHLMRYIAVGCVINKKKKIQLTNLLRILERKEYILVSQFEKDYKYEVEKDPILNFLQKLCTDVDFNGAIQAFDECKVAVEADFFLQEVGYEFISKAKQMLFDYYRKAHKNSQKFNSNIVVASKELETEYAAYAQQVLISKNLKAKRQNK